MVRCKLVDEMGMRKGGFLRVQDLESGSPVGGGAKDKTEAPMSAGAGLGGRFAAISLRKT